ncbi:MAG: M23 family metallopeptidase [Cyanobacteria bacterium P01_E01_bin.34]
MNGRWLGLLAVAAISGAVVMPQSVGAQSCSPAFGGRGACEGLDVLALTELFESAGFTPEEIETALEVFRQLEGEALDYGLTNRLLQHVRDEYLLDYAASRVVQVFGEVVMQENPLAVADVEVWRQGVAELVERYLEQLDVEVVERVLDLLNFGVWGKFDLPLGEREGYLGNTISGSDQEGFSVPCVQMGCAHIEFSTQPVVHGKRWIWGEQEVEGGYGWPLGELNGGMEPTGRHPITDDFKVVLLEVSEQGSSAQFGIYFRVCIKTLFIDSCSPYFIGPFPWFGYREGDWILIGMTDGVSIPAPPAPPAVPPPLQPSPDAIPTPQPSPTPTPEVVVCEGDLENPAPGYPVTSEFGWRIDPITRDQTRFHQGIDLATPQGTAIRASCAGTVFIAGPVDGYGYYVAIRHGNGLTTGYGHLSRIDVVAGQQVSAGEMVGLSGGRPGTPGAGNTTGSHLHFETFVYSEPRNPREYINF